MRALSPYILLWCIAERVRPLRCSRPGPGLMLNLVQFDVAAYGNGAEDEQR